MERREILAQPSALEQETVQTEKTSQRMFLALRGLPEEEVERRKPIRELAGRLEQ
jgi:hypothetical protein